MKNASIIGFLKGCLVSASVLSSTCLSLPAGDMVVSENWMLEKNEVVDGTLTVESGAAVHLNGYTLEVKGLAGSGTVSGGIVPKEYILLEYVETLENQYIDTGIQPSSDSSSVRVEAEVEYKGQVSGKEYVPLVAAANDQNQKNVGLWISPSTDRKALQWSVCNPDDWVKSSPLVEADTVYRVVASWKKDYVTLGVNDHEPVDKKTDRSNSVSNTLYLPGKNAAGSLREHGEFRIYSLKLYRPETELVRSYVPVKRISDGEIGLYDKVRNEFFPSRSDTPFGAGPEIVRGGGELHVNVEAGRTVLNNSVVIADHLRFVKKGDGTYESAKMSLYTGGTAVLQGKILFSGTGDSHYCGFGAWGCEIEVSPGAQIVMKKYQTLNGYNVKIAGDGPDGNGAIYAIAKDSTSRYDLSFIGSLTLSGDASIKSVVQDAFNFNNNRGVVNLTLNGHALTVKGDKRIIAWSVNVPDKGRIIADIESASDKANSCFYLIKNDLNAPEADFEVAANSGIGGESGMIVSNLVMAGTYYPPKDGVSRRFTVLGRYSPKDSCSGYPNILMGDENHLAPTMDLSGLAVAYDSGRGLDFAPSCVVTVDIGSRQVNIGDCLVSFSEDYILPQGVSFRLVAGGEPVDGLDLMVRKGELYNGLYVRNALAPYFARWDEESRSWKFHLKDGSPYPYEWNDGVTADMEAHFDSYAGYQACRELNGDFSKCVMTGFTFSGSDGEADLVPLAFEISPGIPDIDLNGNKIRLPVHFFDFPVTVTSSVPGGEVFVDVPEGVSVVNADVRLSGRLKFTKSGGGSFVGALAQTYDGGTDVVAGKMRPYGENTPAAFGTGDINVFAGALFDVYGNYGYANITLKGGTLTNARRPMTESLESGIFVASLKDADESYLDMSLSGETRYSALYGKEGLATDLGGKTLKVSVNGNLTLNSALTNGTLKVEEKYGWFVFSKAFDMSTTVFDNKCAIEIKGDVDMGSYIQRKDTKYIRGSGRMTVKDRFVPIAEKYFYACTMLDGSTLDLSARGTMFTSCCTNDENRLYSVEFPESGTIYVEIGDRVVRNGEKLVEWENRPSGETRFILRKNGISGLGGLVVSDDGLYVNRGFGVIIR